MPADGNKTHVVIFRFKFYQFELLLDVTQHQSKGIAKQKTFHD